MEDNKNSHTLLSLVLVKEIYVASTNERIE